jgi:hypothetical protein
MNRWICFVAALAVGCSSVTEAELENAFARFECRTRQCASGLAPSLANCGAKSGTGNWAKAVAAGRAGFDAGRAAQCLEALETLAALPCWGGSVDPASLSTVPPVACAGVFSGRRGFGEDCWSDEECAAGFCDDSARTCPGHCLPALAAGAPCSEHADCGEDRVCAGGYCVAPGPVGTACSDASTCQPGLGCAGGVCSSPVAAGGDCSLRGSVCQAGHWCRSADGAATCVVQVATSAECRTAGGLAPECVGRQLCLGAGSLLGQPRTGLCAAPSDVGGPCRPPELAVIQGSGCFSGLLCDPATSTCRVPPRPGEACIAEICDDAAFCASDTCVVKKAGAEPCSQGRECVSGACSGGLGNRRCEAAAPARETVLACLAPERT